MSGMAAGSSQAGLGVRVGVVMGSQSDLAKMSKAWEALSELGIGYEVRVISAHRTPEEAAAYARSAEERGLRVIIAGAGGAAHLAGVMAAYTILPVIGVPIASGALGGFDALCATVMMPSGVPVATVAVDGAANAGVLAAEIIALSDVVKASDEDIAWLYGAQTPVEDVMRRWISLGPGLVVVTRGPWGADTQPASPAVTHRPASTTFQRNKACFIAHPPQGWRAPFATRRGRWPRTGSRPWKRHSSTRTGGPVPPGVRAATAPELVLGSQRVVVPVPPQTAAGRGLDKDRPAADTSTTPHQPPTTNRFARRASHGAMHQNANGCGHSGRSGEYHRASRGHGVVPWHFAALPRPIRPLQPKPSQQ